MEVAFDLAPVGMAVLDHEFAFHLVNDAYCRLLRYPREELLRLRLADVTHPEDQWLDHDWQEFVFDDRIESLSREKRMVARDGETIWVTMNSRKTVNEASRPFTVNSIEPMKNGRREQAELVSKAEWTSRIKEALASDNFVLHGQPILNLATDEVEQHELLLRMKRNGARRRLISPGEFMPPAEKYDLVDQIDKWVVGQALHIAKDMPVTVNLSGSTITHLELITAIERAIESLNVRPENLVFEITETAVVNNLEAAEMFVDHLHRLGCRFALDDFGTGFGTYSYLKHLPVDFLKIDIEFVKDMIHNETDRKVVRAIAAAAELFGIATIAEGVEDADTLELLREYRIDFAQGFHIGRPSEIGG